MTYINTDRDIYTYNSQPHKTGRHTYTGSSHTYIKAGIQRLIHGNTYMHTCINAYTHAYINTCILTYIHTYRQTNTYIHTYRHTYIHTAMHKY